jgi:hypothetical protein
LIFFLRPRLDKPLLGISRQASGMPLVLGVLYRSVYTSGIAAGIVMSLDLGVGINGVKCFIIVGTMQRSFQSFAFGLMMYPDKSTRNALSTLALTRSSKWQSTSLVRSLHSLLYHVQCKWLTAIRFTRRSEHFTSLLWICSADVNLLQP